MSELLTESTKTKYRITSLTEAYEGSTIEGNFPPISLKDKIKYCLVVLAGKDNGRSNIFPLDARYVSPEFSISLDSPTQIGALAEASGIARKSHIRFLAVFHEESSRGNNVLDGIIHRD
ncbi:MAG: hypothetical protein WCO33_00440 [bacterium]